MAIPHDGLLGQPAESPARQKGRSPLSALSEADIEIVILDLEAKGVYPSVDAVYGEIGRSRVRIANYLKDRRHRRKDLVKRDPQSFHPALAKAMLVVQAELETQAMVLVEKINAQTEDEKEALFQEQESLREKLHASNRQMDEYRAEIVRLQTRLDYSATETLKLTGELAAAQARAEEQGKSLEQMKRQIHDYRQATEGFRQTILDLEKTHEKQLKEVKSQVSHTLTEMAERQHIELEKLKRDHENLLAEAASTHQKEITAKEEKIADLEDRLAYIKRAQAQPWRRKALVGSN